MTLMELMVGIVITGAVALIGGATFNSIIEHRRVILEANAEVERAAALREMLRTWIGSGTIQITTGGATARGVRGATVTRPTIATPTSSTVPAITAAASTGDELTFVTNALTPIQTSSTRVRLFVDMDPNTPETGLTIEYQSAVQTQASPLQRRQLDSTIVAMSVEFLDQTTGIWYPYSEAATIRPMAASLYFPPVDNYYVPPLLQYPLLFVMGAPATNTTTTIGGGGRGR
jgi:Tfp pilus assembly protein FimT